MTCANRSSLSGPCGRNARRASRQYIGDEPEPGAGSSRGSAGRFSPGARRNVYPNLKLHLWISGIRQNRLAQMLDMDETVLSRIVNGFRAVSPEMRARIAELLKADEDWLFDSNGRDDANGRFP